MLDGSNGGGDELITMLSRQLKPKSPLRQEIAVNVLLELEILCMRNGYESDSEVRAVVFHGCI